ncbi:hypothetical protein FRB94_000686 [Tulasnella sp. JGI-2019a]|nr:hypothetical protein FRB93_011902 [Tulasnella sp. JGI-2019a]KAG9006448.1 hypothetical protein FRB94_000686 [Tulasnella sp. JGI-2019a]KAG9036942.1 hypothetical protein FRB95_007505 [Tulasnella sp. JGI-2019a]
MSQDLIKRYAVTLNNHKQKGRVDFTTVQVPDGLRHKESWTVTIKFTYARNADNEEVAPFFEVGHGATKGKALTAASFLALRTLGYIPPNTHEPESEGEIS